jgi:hypothetical protein
MSPCATSRGTLSTIGTTAARSRSVLNGNYYYYPRVSYAELAKATDGFAEGNLVGAGKYGPRHALPEDE